jgi:Outer membrane protein beta-barrel domain
MIQKFAAVPGIKPILAAIIITILAATTTVLAQNTQAPAQQPPAQPAQAQQQPENQQSSSQEAPEEETRRRAKPKDYRNWSFNVGGGASLTSGTTKQFVRGGGGIAAAGVARNYSKYFGFRLDFQWDNLPLRQSALQQAQAPGGNSHVYTLMLDPIINIPVTREWGGYILGGPSYYHRSGKLDSSTAVPGSGCNAFYTWWGSCFNGSLPLNGHFLKASQNEFGENFGAGITRKINSRFEFYAEFRLLHGSHNGLTTDLRPITVGLRW